MNLCGIVNESCQEISGKASNFSILIPTYTHPPHPSFYTVPSTRPLRSSTKYPSSLQSQGDPSNAVDGQIRRRRQSMAMAMVHRFPRLTTPCKPVVCCMCIKNMTWKPDEPTTSAATVDEFAHQDQWMDRHGCRESLGYWDEEGVCMSMSVRRWWG
jgi:hypothetical protein